MPTAAPKELKTTRIVVKLTPREKQEIEQRAADLGLDAAVLLRTAWRWYPRPKTTRP